MTKNDAMKDAKYKTPRFPKHLLTNLQLTDLANVTLHSSYVILHNCLFPHNIVLRQWAVSSSTAKANMFLFDCKA